MAYPASADTTPITIICAPLRAGWPTVIRALNAPTANSTTAEKSSPAHIAVMRGRKKNGSSGTSDPATADSLTSSASASRPSCAIG